MILQLALLERAALEDRLAHLLLFHGESAEHQREVALRIGQILNCKHPTQEGPCQECTSCRKMRSGNHPDMLWLKPLKTSIGIEQILGWQEKLFLKHYEGTYKISVIEKADALTLPAANALLKVIEEPPERTIIILCAENVEGILPTIRSRAQLVYFPGLSQEEWLSGFEEADQIQALQAFRLSGKNRNLAKAILENGVPVLLEWVGQFCLAVNERDFLKLFNLFPLDKNQAVLYLQVMAVQAQEEIQKGTYNPSKLLAIGKALDALRHQVSPRIVIEVLALELFRQGGTLCD